jgi:predicted  nucleic acid-binding Zn-ribbon protein
MAEGNGHSYTENLTKIRERLAHLEERMSDMASLRHDIRALDHSVRTFCQESATDRAKLHERLDNNAKLTWANLVAVLGLAGKLLYDLATR